MKCDVKVTSMYSGENTSVEGIVFTHEPHAASLTSHRIEVQGSASDRGAYATVNGEDKWWCGSESPDSDGPQEIEETVEKIFEIAWDAAETDENIDEDDRWEATVVDGKVTSIQQISEPEAD